jgi:TorA maturation chaperone TorD
VTSDPTTFAATTQAADLAGVVRRANAYHVLAQAFRTPAEWQPTLSDELRRRFARLGSPLRERGAETAEAWEVALHDRERAAVAHARLFLGPFEVQAPPYASLYLDPEQRLMGAVSQEVARAYAEAGLGPGPGPKDAPDHVTAELEFMYFLAFQEATTAEPEWAERQRRFWQTHLGRWLPELAGRIAAAEPHPFYAALARLVACFAASEGCLARRLDPTEALEDSCTPARPAWRTDVAD